MIKYEIREHFAKYVSRELNEREIHPWYLAHYSDASERVIGASLKMKKLPRIDSLILIAELFECTINDLLGFKAVDVQTRDTFFNPGIDSKRVADYFTNQITERGFIIDDFRFNEPDMDVELKRCIRFRRLPNTDAFLQICEALDCTPSELLGY